MFFTFISLFTITLSLVLAGCQTGGVSESISTQSSPERQESSDQLENVTNSPGSLDYSGSDENPSLDSWAGAYAFAETSTDDGQRQIWLYDLELFQQKDGSWAGSLNIDGFDTLKRYNVRGELKGDRMQVILDDYREGSMGESPSLNSTLFILEEVSNSGKRSIVTQWEKLEPYLSSTPRVGIAFLKPYMKRPEPSD